jgi:hypothetical protein
LDFADMNVDLADTGKTHFNFMEAPAGSRLYAVLVSSVFTVARHTPTTDAPSAAEPEAPAATVEASTPAAESPAAPEETPVSSEAAPPPQPAPQPVASGAYPAYYGPNRSPYYNNQPAQYGQTRPYNGWSPGYRPTYARPAQRYRNRRW